VINRAVYSIWYQSQLLANFVGKFHEDTLGQSYPFKQFCTHSSNSILHLPQPSVRSVQLHNNFITRCHLNSRTAIIPAAVCCRRTSPYSRSVSTIHKFSSLRQSYNAVNCNSSAFCHTPLRFHSAVFVTLCLSPHDFRIG
jgi:hypothetical protein